MSGVSKYRYYIWSTDGNVIGLDDEAKAREYTDNEDFFVVDVEKGWVLNPDGTNTVIKDTP